MKTTDYIPVCPAADAGKMRMRTAAASCGVLVMMLPAMLGQFGVQAAPPRLLPAVLLLAPEHSHELDDCDYRPRMHEGLDVCTGESPDVFECLPTSGGDCFCQHEGIWRLAPGVRAMLPGGRTYTPATRIQGLVRVHGLVNKQWKKANGGRHPLSLLRREVLFFAKFAAAYEDKTFNRMDYSPEKIAGAIQNVWNGDDPFDATKPLTAHAFTPYAGIDFDPLQVATESHTHSGSGCLREPNAACASKPNTPFFDCVQIGTDRWICVHATETAPSGPRHRVELTYGAMLKADLTLAQGGAMNVLARQAWLVRHLIAARRGLGAGWMHLTDSQAAGEVKLLMGNGSGYRDHDNP